MSSFVDQFATAPDHEDGAEVQIYNERLGEMSTLFIRVQGIDSQAYRAVQAKIRKKAYEASVAGEKFDTEAGIVDGLVEITLGWRGIEQDGEEVEFTPDRCRELYEAAPYIRDQVDRFVSNRANFTKG